MSESMPRAPRLEPGACIATAALVESAQRVFHFHSTSPLHWIDLCTLIEAAVLHDKIAFPVIHHEYAEPLVKPLQDAGLLDVWWPEAGVFNGPSSGTKEHVWRDSPQNDAAKDAIRLLCGGWPDSHYDSLSATRRAAIDGIAHGFAEPALYTSKEDKDEVGILLWGTGPRRTSASRVEDAAASYLQKGIAKIQTTSPAERAAFAIPHVTPQDTYNAYAKCLRDLANDASALLIKSVIEEPYFDPVSVEDATRQSLHTVLKGDYERNIVRMVDKYVKIVPVSPLAGIALSKAESINEVVKIAVDMRDAFKSYRDLLAQYRDLQDEIAISQTFAAAKEADNIREHFEQALQASMKKINTDLDMTSKVVFDGLQGIRKFAVAVVSGDFKGAVDQATEQLVELLKGWRFMNYGGVYEIVSQYPRLEQLGAASNRLIKKDLDVKIANLVKQASEVIKSNYGLVNMSDSKNI